MNNIKVGQIYIFNDIYDFSIWKIMKIKEPDEREVGYEIILQSVFFSDTLVRYVSKLTSDLYAGDLLSNKIENKQQIIRKTLEVYI